MAWNWRNSLVMSIWCKCIKRKNKIIHTQPCTPNLLDNPYVSTYKLSSLYLGKEGRIALKNGTTEIYIHYSERDGIGWIFKSLSPYKVLYSYDDGAYYINDSSQGRYIELTNQLESLRKQAHSQHFLQSFVQLEKITTEFLNSMVGD